MSTEVFVQLAPGTQKFLTYLVDTLLADRLTRREQVAATVLAGMYASGVVIMSESEMEAEALRVADTLLSEAAK